MAHAALLCTHAWLLAHCLLAAFALATPASGQTARTPDGRPDLQGLWLNDTATPLERPAALAGRAAFTPEEASAYERRYQADRTVASSRNKDFELDASASDLDTYEPGRVLPGGRTSMITDPPTGLVPPLLPGFYNNTLQIVQTRDAVVILSEQIHDARVISLTRRTHLQPRGELLDVEHPERSAVPGAEHEVGARSLSARFGRACASAAGGRMMRPTSHALFAAAAANLEEKLRAIAAAASQGPWMYKPNALNG